MTAEQRVDVLALAAHRDDVEITSGGLMTKFADMGYRTAIIDFTAGEMGTRGTAADREAEAAAAAKIMGLAHRENLEMPDAHLENTLPARLRVVDVLRRLRPRLVILPHWVQRHPDHRVAGEIAYEACFLAGLEKLDVQGEPHRPHKILYSGFFRPPPMSFIVDITDQFDRKIESVRAYRSQFDTPEGARQIYAPGIDIFELMTTEAKHMGRQIRTRYAESYIIKEAIAIDDPLQMNVPSI
ncbi:MAG TPA: bacillithiol biosynthesis deacetylase BshB1 [Acidobacteriota bacterium]|nr:bacillithiol biosynthesis deacetylase BshB1 [Acidobacteriota bacterium]